MTKFYVIGVGLAAALLASTAMLDKRQTVETDRLGGWKESNQCLESHVQTTNTFIVIGDLWLPATTSVNICDRYSYYCPKYTQCDPAKKPD